MPVEGSLISKSRFVVVESQSLSEDFSMSYSRFKPNLIHGLMLYFTPTPPKGMMGLCVAMPFVPLMS